jgi:hypothetical protein
MTKASLRAAGLMVLLSGAFPFTLRGQAAMEYAVQTGKSVSTSNGAVVAGCQVDSELLSCLGRTYPQGAIVAVVIILFMLLWWFARSTAHGSG